MEWTREPPDAEGWYWHRFALDREERSRVVCVLFWPEGGFGCNRSDLKPRGWGAVKVEEAGGWWAGPIPHPPLPSEALVDVRGCEEED